jgi:hypothetical protein
MRSPSKSNLMPESARTRSDGRRTLLVYMDPDLIKDIKKVALDEERTVYEIVEEATRAWMTQRSTSRTKKSNKVERK